MPIAQIVWCSAGPARVPIILPFIVCREEAPDKLPFVQKLLKSQGLSAKQPLLLT